MAITCCPQACKPCHHPLLLVFLTWHLALGAAVSHRLCLPCLPTQGVPALPAYLPARSAVPSPPHMMPTATMPGSPCLQYIRMMATKDAQYMRGPCSSSFGMPLRVTDCTSVGSLVMPRPAASILRVAPSQDDAAASSLRGNSGDDVVKTCMLSSVQGLVYAWMGPAIVDHHAGRAVLLCTLH